MPLLRKLTISLLFLLLLFSAAFAGGIKPAIPAGVPWDLKNNTAPTIPQDPARFDQPLTGPYPTNKWYGNTYTCTQYHKFGLRMIPGPMMVDYNTGTGGTAYCQGYLIGRQRLVCEPTSVTMFGKSSYGIIVAGVYGPGNTIINSAATVFKSNTDWSFTGVVVDKNDPAKRIRTTFGKGFIFTYNYYSQGVTPRFYTKFSDRIFYNAEGQPFSGSVVSDRIMIHTKSSTSGSDDFMYYGIYAPEGSTFTISGTNSVDITFPASAVNEEDRYLAVSLLHCGAATAFSQTEDFNKAKTNFDDYYRYAYNFITDTKVSWTNNRADGTLTTRYDFTLEDKRPSSAHLEKNKTLFAVYPHQWKNMQSTISRSYTYNTIRGVMKVAEGNHFITTQKFSGIMPGLTYEVPSENMSKLQTYINYDRNFDITNSGTDTYFRGKALARAANLIPIFHQQGIRTGDMTARDNMITKLKNELQRWYKAESGSYFAYDTIWGGIIGYPYSFRSNNYNDHNFHYGYFVYASAILAIYDRDFASQYKGIVDLIIKDYANHERNDISFPFLRGFDVYEGHSWANGANNTDDRGNDQESSSEAMNAWAGIYLWGIATGDQNLIDLGTYGYLTEYSAIREYYFDVDGSVYNNIYIGGGILFESMTSYSVWWSTSRSQEKMGIWILPLTPSMLYLGYETETDYQKNYYDRMYAIRDTDKPNMWKDIWLRFKSLYNAQEALSDWNNTNLSSSDYAGNDGGSSLTLSYHFINFFNALGTVDTSYYADTESFAVMKKASANTFIAYNQDCQNSKNVTFYNRLGAAVGKSIKVPPRTFASTDGNFKRLKLDPLTGYVAQYRTDFWDAAAISGIDDFTAEPFLKISSATLPESSGKYIYLPPCFTLTKTNTASNFNNPITIELNYSDYIFPSTVVESELRLAFFNPVTQETSILPVAPDTANKTITIMTSSEGSFYLVQPEGYYAQYAQSSWNVSVFGHYSDFTSDPDLSLKGIPLPQEDEWFIFIGPAFEFSKDPTVSFNNPIPLTVEYDINSLPKGTEESKLRLAYIDPVTSKIIVLPNFNTAPDINTHTLTVNTNITGKFILVLPLDTPRKFKVKLYPNPYKPGKHANSGITFDKVKQGARIRVYNIAGEKVYDKIADKDNFVWDVKNNSGGNIASGIYIYYVDSNGQIHKGKIAIER